MRERQKQVQPAYERVARSNDSLDYRASANWLKKLSISAVWYEKKLIGGRTARYSCAADCAD